ncbi:hypothetical protein [Treponema pedis]|uniref:Uncharacterized protein n=2 Tax=Treponema pedis TaxID=409322 RepID=S6A429_9SPIR|nr:hypothetical protein [Treponema pedis]AGT44041.1 hypothetical protein TPE_1546 [Treponema pedis str. T A4]QOW61878.1 hypothetical protein IFE08_05830 [Treponema pedis]QSI04765.1 hypothetical protein DYQ05_07365 [Treponema pedis]
MSINGIQYTFSDNELKQLALFFRKNNYVIPKSLEALAEFAENYVYGKTTIAEAEAFFESAN